MPDMYRRTCSADRGACRRASRPPSAHRGVPSAPPPERTRERPRPDGVCTTLQMHIVDIFAASPSTCSFEFFPPKTDKAANQLYETLRSLERVGPSFVSVTYGAGGSSRQLTHDLVTRIQQTTSLTAIPHLTCICNHEAEID